jgi:hypothetical protein
LKFYFPIYRKKKKKKQKTYDEGKRREGCFCRISFFSIEREGYMAKIRMSEMKEERSEGKGDGKDEAEKGELDEKREKKPKVKK